MKNIKNQFYLCEVKSVIGLARIDRKGFLSRSMHIRFIFGFLVDAMLFFSFIATTALRRESGETMTFDVSQHNDVQSGKTRRLFSAAVL